MGITGAGPFVRRLKSGDGEPIQTRFDSLHRALEDIKASSQAPSTHFTLYIDFWAVLYGHFVELSGQHHRPAIKADLLIKLFGRHYVDRSDDVLGQLMDRLDDHVQTARKAFADRKLDVVVVIDNASVETQAKYLKRKERLESNLKAAARYKKAVESLERLAHSKYSGQWHGREDSGGQQGTLPGTNNFRLRKRWGKRTLEWAIRAQMKEIKKTAWTGVHLNCSAAALNALARERFEIQEEKVVGFSFADKEDRQVKAMVSSFDEDQDCNDKLEIEDYAIPNQNDIAKAATEWKASNEHLLQAASRDSMAKLIVSADEADITLLNLMCNKKTASVSILMSSDSDYQMFTDRDELHFTLQHSRRVVDKETRYLARTAWIRTDILALHASIQQQWPTRYARISAALLAGHDYTGSGLYGAGLSSLMRSCMIDKDEMKQTLAKVIRLGEQKGDGKQKGYWSKAATQVRSRSGEVAFSDSKDVTASHVHIVSRILHALRVLLLRRHRPVRDEVKAEFDKIFTLRAERRVTGIANHVNPFAPLAIERRNLQLLFDVAIKKENRVQPVIQGEASRLKLSSNVARSPDTSLPQKAHAAWVYDENASAEKVRPRKQRKKECLLDNALADQVAEIPGPDPSKELRTQARGDEADTRIRMYEDPDEEAEEQAAAQAEINEEEDDGLEVDDNDDGEPDDAEEDGESSEMDDLGEGESETGGKRKRSTAGHTARKRKQSEKATAKETKETAVTLSTMFPTRTHCRWLPSTLHSLTNDDVRQKHKPLLPLIQLAVFTEKLTVKETLVPIYNEYMERLLDDTDARFLYRFRTFHASKIENETTLIRNMIRLFTASKDDEASFAFMNYRHEHSPRTLHETAIPAIVEGWIGLHVLSTKGAKAEEVHLTRQALTKRLNNFNADVIAYLYDHAKHGYDYALASMMDDCVRKTGGTEVNSTMRDKVTVPLAPLAYPTETLGRYGSILHKAFKWKLRGMSLQQALSCYVKERCIGAMAKLSREEAARAHEGVYTYVVETSVEGYYAGKVGEDSQKALARAISVLGDRPAKDIVDKIMSIMLRTMETEAHHMALRDFFKGKDKMQFGLRHTRLFFREIGYDFSVTCDPTFVFWNSKRLAGHIKRAGYCADSMIKWINRNFLSDLDSAMQGADIRGMSSHRFGCLDTMQCFEHCRLGGQRARLLAATGSTKLEMSQDWLVKMEAYASSFKSAPGIAGGHLDSRSGESRSALFDVVFRRCIPKQEIWGGFFETDGFNLRMASHDPGVCRASDIAATLEKTGKQINADGRVHLNTGELLKYMVAHKKQNFAELHVFELDNVGTCTHLSPNGTIQRRPIRSSGWYARTSANRAVRLVSKLPGQMTEGGLPKGMTKLETSDDATKVMDALRALEPERASDSFKLVGDDLGIRFAQAIHINTPGTDGGSGSSETVLLAPYALAEASRTSAQKRQELRACMPLSASRLLQEADTIGRSRASKVRNIVDLALKCSRSYCHIDFRRMQQVRRFYDKAATQLCEILWPKGQDERPVLFAVGDGCGASNKTARKHHADYGTSSLRQLMKRLKSQGKPVEFVRVNEAFSSQVCPDPACKEESGLRSSLEKLPYRGTTGKCLRVHQCVKCHKTYHRDTAAAMNIGFIAWHVLVHGKHPWDDGKGRGGASRRASGEGASVQ